MRFIRGMSLLSFFFFNDTATTEIYTLSLHDALPIYWNIGPVDVDNASGSFEFEAQADDEAEFFPMVVRRSEEHTSELQSPCNLVCRLLLEKKNKTRHLLNYLAPRSRTAASRVTSSGY